MVDPVYKRLLVRLILACVIVIMVVFVMPRLVQILLPFLMASLGAAIIVPIAQKINLFAGRLNKNINLPRKATTFVLNILVLIALSFAVYYAASTLVREVISLASSVQQNWSSIAVKYDELLEHLTFNTQLMPELVIDVLEDAKDSILVFVQDLSKNIVSFTVSTTASGITNTATFFVNVITFFLALFFISLDSSLISDWIHRYTSRRAMENFSLLKTSVIAAVGGYLRAQLILATFAFLFMFVALTIYGQPYAFTIALFLGFIDLLPIIGTIAMLLPWGGIEFFVGDLNKGIFLILVGIAFFLIRKVIEPKIMGDQTGLHPLLALLSTYVGLQFSGVWGAVLGPVVLMLMISMTKSGIFANTASDLRGAYGAVSGWFRNEE